MKKEFLISLGLALLIIAGFAYMSRSNTDRSFGQDRDRACCAPKDYTGLLDSDERIAVYEGRSMEVPDLVFETKVTDVLGVSQEERWIEVDLSEQKLRAWEGDELFLETLISTGLPWYPTPQGEFWIWIKLRATKMEGGSGRHYYYLPNVPYVMFFYNDKILAYRGYGLHGTYWHSDFGTQRSHGCVNLPTSVAEQLYYWTWPVLPEGKYVVRATDENPGTRIVIHE